MVTTANGTLTLEVDNNIINLGDTINVTLSNNMSTTQGSNYQYMMYIDDTPLTILREDSGRLVEEDNTTYGTPDGVTKRTVFRTFVYSPPAGVHTLSIVWYNGRNTLGEDSVTLNVIKPSIVEEVVNVYDGSATLIVNKPIPVGTYVIMGNYAENNNYQQGTDTATLTITKTPTMAVINGTTSPIDIGNSVTLTATVTDGNDPVTEGNFTLYEDDTPVVFNQTINNQGSCTLIYTPTSVGTHDYHITYNGTSTYESVTSQNYEIVVEKITPVITLNNTDYVKGETVNFTGTILNSKTNQPLPTTVRCTAKINGVTLKDSNGNIIYGTTDVNGNYSFSYDTSNLNIQSYTLQIVCPMSELTNAGRQDFTINIIEAEPEPTTILPTLTQSTYEGTYESMVEESSLLLLCTLTNIEGTNENGNPFMLDEVVDYTNDETMLGDCNVLIIKDNTDLVGYRGGFSLNGETGYAMDYNYTPITCDIASITCVIDIVEQTVEFTCILEGCPQEFMDAPNCSIILQQNGKQYWFNLTQEEVEE